MTLFTRWKRWLEHLLLLQKERIQADKKQARRELAVLQSRKNQFEKSSQTTTEQGEAFIEKRKEYTELDSDFTLFLNIINKWYAKDTSKKIWAVFKAKGESGKPLCTNPPYGYLKDPEDKHHWIVDGATANVVRDIFRMCVAGKGLSQIAKALTEQRIPIPTANLRSMGINTPIKVSEDIYAWQQATISYILKKQEYLGHTVNFKTQWKSYKHKKKVNNDPSEWVIFENTHEAIIDQETF